MLNINLSSRERPMSIEILSPQYLADYLQGKAEHDHSERLHHFRRDAILAALKDIRTFTQDGYVATIIEHQRSIFRHKRLALAHADLYEEFLEIIPIRQLLVTGPLGMGI